MTLYGLDCGKWATLKSTTRHQADSRMLFASRERKRERQKDRKTDRETARRKGKRINGVTAIRNDCKTATLDSHADRQAGGQGSRHKMAGESKLQQVSVSLLQSCVIYPHALKASQSSERPQRPQRPHRFERLNLAATEKRGHIVDQRHLVDDTDNGHTREKRRGEEKERERDKEKERMRHKRQQNKYINTGCVHYSCPAWFACCWGKGRGFRAVGGVRGGRGGGNDQSFGRKVLKQRKGRKAIQDSIQFQSAPEFFK